MTIELTKRAGMEDLSNIVKVRRLTLRGHTLWLPPAIDRQAWLCSGHVMETREEKDVQVRHGDRQSRKILRR